MILKYSGDYAVFAVASLCSLWLKNPLKVFGAQRTQRIHGGHEENRKSKSEKRNRGIRICIFLGALGALRAKPLRECMDRKVSRNSLKI